MTACMSFGCSSKKTVQKVRQTLHALQVIQNGQKQLLMLETADRDAGREDYQESARLLHLQQMSHSLATVLQRLDSSCQGNGTE